MSHAKRSRANHTRDQSDHIDVNRASQRLNVQCLSLKKTKIRSSSSHRARSNIQLKADVVFQVVSGGKGDAMDLLAGGVEQLFIYVPHMCGIPQMKTKLTY